MDRLDSFSVNVEQALKDLAAESQQKADRASVDERIDILQRTVSVMDGVIQKEMEERMREGGRIWEAIDGHSHDFAKEVTVERPAPQPVQPPVVYRTGRVWTQILAPVVRGKSPDRPVASSAAVLPAVAPAGQVNGSPLPITTARSTLPGSFHVPSGTPVVPAPIHGSMGAPVMPMPVQSGGGVIPAGIASVTGFSMTVPASSADSRKVSETRTEHVTCGHTVYADGSRHHAEPFDDANKSI